VVLLEFVAGDVVMGEREQCLDCLVAASGADQGSQPMPTLDVPWTSLINSAGIWASFVFEDLEESDGTCSPSAWRSVAPGIV